MGRAKSLAWLVLAVLLLLIAWEVVLPILDGLAAAK